MAQRSTGDEARKRVLEAARQEFAQHGLAGARVDRIGVAARVSKERLYTYFGNKEALWREVMEDEIAALDQVGRPETVDGPAIATRLFDHFLDDPTALRTFTWLALEEERHPEFADARRQHQAQKVAAITRARGESVNAELVLMLLITVAAASAREAQRQPHDAAARASIRRTLSETAASIL